MDIPSSNTSQKSILLQLANNILQCLQQDIQIDDEDYLYNDEFYITIVSSIVPENTCQIQIGETDEEKAESLHNLIEFLSSIVEMNLEHINGPAIIMEKDSESVKHLLELILELIVVLREEQNEQEELEDNSNSRLNIHENLNYNNDNENFHNNNYNDDDNIHIDDSSNLNLQQNEDISNLDHSENNENNQNNYNAFSLGENPNKFQVNMQSPVLNNKNESYLNNNSDINYNYNNENKSLPPAEFEPEDNSQINYKEYYSQNDLTRYEKVMNYLANNEEQLQDNYNQNKNNSDLQINNNHMNIFNNSQFMEDDDSKPAVNISRISEVSRSKENYSEPHSKNNKINKNYTNDNITDIKITNSNIKLTSHLDSYGPSKISSVDSRLNPEEILNTDFNNKNKVNEPNYEEDEFLFRNDTENLESVDLDMDDVSRSDFNNNNVINVGSQKVSNRNNINIQQNLNSKNNNTKNNNKNIQKNNTYNSSKKSSNQNVIKKESSNSKISNNKLNSNKVTQNRNKSISVSNQSQSNQSINNNSQLEKFESSHHQEKTLKKTKSQTKLINNSNDLSMSSLQHNKNTSYYKDEISENLIEELPLSEENLKFEIMKEFRRIYGDKLDKIMLKNNLNNSANMFEVILRNIKLARQRMMKIGIGHHDPDDVITKEFMQKYNKELEYIINHYHNEEKRRNYFKSKAINTFSKNYSLMNRLQEIENKNLETEIERRRKSREIRNKHNQIKICNEIYSKALELEKQKYLEERATQAELRKQENNEKRSVMIQIENYYKDKINILKEILRREKYEKEIEHRAKIQFLSKFEREKKANFKKQIDVIFERLDEEDRKADFQSANSEQLEKILNNYYKK